LMNLLHHLWTQRLYQSTHGLRIGNFFRSDAGELPVHQAQGRLRGRLLPPTSTAVRSPLSLRFIDRVQQLGVVQHLVSVLHPGLPPPGRFFRKPSLPQHPLLAPPFNHRLSSVSSLSSAFSCCAATAP